MGAGQFVIKTKVTCQTEEKNAKILIDTGAQPNLVRKNLFSPHLFKNSLHPLTLSAANGGRVEGGQKEIILTLTFRNLTSGENMSFRGLFFEADIPLDMILSHGWMGKNKLVPVPEFTQLALRRGDQLQMLQPFPAILEKQIHTRPLTLTPTCRELFCGHVPIETEKQAFCVPGEIGERDKPLNYSEKVSITDAISACRKSPRKTPLFGLVQTEDFSEHPLAVELKQKLFEEYKDTVFREEIYPNPQPRGPHGTATIQLRPGTTPKHVRAIPCHGEKLEHLRKILGKWQSNKKIEPAEPSGWGSPMFLVPKPNRPDDPYRPVIDVRAPNAAAEIDSYTIPLIDDLITRQGQKHIWSKLDLKDAFSQIPLAPAARPIFKITTPLGDFQPTIMPQGYRNAPSIFQREMDNCLHSVQEIASAYFDDIIAGSFREGTQTEEQLIWKHYSDIKKF